MRFSIFITLTLLSLTSCHQESKKTFISSTKSEWYDRIYDENNNLIYYLPVAEVINISGGEVIILDLKTMKYTRKEIEIEQK